MTTSRTTGRFRSSFTALPLLAALLGLMAGCGKKSPVAPTTTGTVRVTTATTGVELDADGYMIALDGGTAQPIGVSATVTFNDVAAGGHSATLSGLAANCSVTGSNPRSATVAAGGTSAVDFAVACMSTAGNIEVAMNATGADLPTDVGVTIDGVAEAGVVPVNSSNTYGLYDVGNHAVEIDVPANCTLASGTNPRTVTVASGTSVQTVTTTFDLTCVSTTGNIEVAMNATGANLPASVNVTIDSQAQGGVVNLNSSNTYGLYPVGAHTVEIDVPANCTLASGVNPRTVTIPSGATVQTETTTFDLTCGSTVGYIEVAMNATGANLPASVSVTIDSQSQPTVVNLSSSTTYGQFAIGDHSVEIALPANCSLASGTNPRTVTVPSGATLQTVTTTYDLTCVSTVGYVEVAMNATGANLPASVSVTIDSQSQPTVVNLNSSSTYGQFTVGDHSVEIALPANCSLASGTNPRTVTVPPGATLQTVTTTFDLTCVSTVGYIEVAMNATGSNLPASVNVLIDGQQVGGVVNLNSSSSYGQYAVGDHSVGIVMPGNCSLSTGVSPRTVTIPSGATLQTVTTTFDLTCS